MSLAGNIANRIDVADCWEWRGAADKDGYGLGMVGYTLRRVHRYVWETLVGPIPDGLVIDHLCRNKRCCNPDHLQVVTVAENTRRGIPANKTLCANGHELTPENTVRCRRGWRSCRACKRGSDRQSAARRRVRERSG